MDLKNNTIPNKCVLSKCSQLWYSIILQIYSYWIDYVSAKRSHNSKYIT